MTTPLHRGKVRDSYELDEHHLLVVASDRISVFDVVLDREIPGKGKVLTELTLFWLTRIFDDVPNHLVTTDMWNGIPIAMHEIPDLDGRGMVVQRAEMLPVECIVRGYLYGSVMNEYQKHQTASGIKLPPGLEKASQLPQPIFTPSTKAPKGQHDENITLAQAGELVEPELLAKAEELSLEIYTTAAAYTLELGFILADTKFEFGLVNGVLTLCDEVLTPDSSRFWELGSWEPGKEPTSFDKQPVRNYYESLGWDKRAPAPFLPDEVVAATQARYAEVQRRLTD